MIVIETVAHLDRAYGDPNLCSRQRELNVTSHVTKNDKARGSNLDRRSTRHDGCGPQGCSPQADTLL